MRNEVWVDFFNGVIGSSVMYKIVLDVFLIMFLSY